MVETDKCCERRKRQRTEGFYAKTVECSIERDRTQLCVINLSAVYTNERSVFAVWNSRFGPAYNGQLSSLSAFQVIA